MGNTPRTRPVRVAKPAAALPVDDGIQLWDEFIEEAFPVVEPWAKRLSDGTLIEVGCPTSTQLELVTAAEAVGDIKAMITAVFATHAERVIELTAHKPFPVRVRLVYAVLMHYGLANLPEASASST